jgi:benzoyl-CoA reductase subunit B
MSDAAKQRHQERTQLQVTHSLRAHQRAWFKGVQQRVADGEPYVLTSPIAPHEIFEALDIPFVTDAWYSGLVAARRQSAHFSNVLTEHGYHDGLRRYMALGLGVVLDEDHPDKPWGGLPKAAAVVSTNEGGGGAAEMARRWDVPYIGLDQPVMRVMHPEWWSMERRLWEDYDETDRIDFMVDQFEEVVALAERIAGRRLDRERLAEIVHRVNEQEEHFDAVRRIIIEAPKLPARLGEVMSQTMGIQWHRGTPWALEQAAAFHAEVKARADAEQWVCPNERHRLMYVGAGLWQKLDFFDSFEDSHGVVFVRSNYLSIASDGYLRYGFRDPIRALASRYTTLAKQMWIPPLGGAWAVHEAREHRVNGALQLEANRGIAFITRALEAAGVPVLDLPVDPVDARSWNDERMRALVIEFVERRLEGAPQERMS